VIADVLPPCVIAREQFVDPPEVVLFDVERAYVAQAADRRRREFATVRQCARQALGQLGYPPMPLVPGEGGAPQWPSGAVGSMTHCAGYRAAAVAQTDDILTLGIDAEPHEPLPVGVLEIIARADELAQVAALRGANSSLRWDRLLFSCKESVYKAWFPLTGAWLDFDQVSITIDPQRRSFCAHLVAPQPTLDMIGLDTFWGRWTLSAGFLLTAVAVSARPDDSGQRHDRSRGHLLGPWPG
jgi:4'-phosphopantetheinyl transferase EntD